LVAVSPGLRLLRLTRALPLSSSEIATLPEAQLLVPLVVCALVNLSNLKPGDTATKCINVTYTGSLAATVKLYTSASTDTGLGQYLDFSIDEGTGATGGASLDCTGFTLGSALFPAGTLSGFLTAKNSYPNGVSTWAPAGASNAVKSYRFTWTLQDNNSAQSKSASATFTWEARNS
jgi:hypothetical protein